VTIQETMGLDYRGALALARTSVAEALRDRVLYALLLFAVGLILMSAVLSNLTLGYRDRIVTDLCLSAVTFAGMAMAVLLGVGSVAREIERRTVQPLLAKPITRTSFVIGKFAGVSATVALNVGLMMIAATIAEIGLLIKTSAIMQILV
jgi:ABC-type transport system involved in multi-copper enzyme maturation permease subunit